MAGYACRGEKPSNDVFSHPAGAVCTPGGASPRVDGVPSRTPDLVHLRARQITRSMTAPSALTRTLATSGRQASREEFHSASGSRWQLAFQKSAQLARRTTQAHVELPEERIHRADVIEAHLVNQLLEDQRIVGEQVDAPLPVVKSDRAGDDLPHFARIASADESMLTHLAGPFLDGQGVPVLVFTAFAVHRIEAGVAVGRDCGEQPRPHRFFLPHQSLLDLAIPFLRMRFDAPVDQGLVNLGG